MMCGTIYDNTKEKMSTNIKIEFYKTIIAETGLLYYSETWVMAAKCKFLRGVK